MTELRRAASHLFQPSVDHTMKRYASDRVRKRMFLEMIHIQIMQEKTDTLYTIVVV